ncbi:MAG: toprim domain-containing protein [Nitrososphaerota archaeon]
MMISHLLYTIVVVICEVTTTRKHKHAQEYEEIVEIVKRMVRESEEGSLIIVEGERDLKALRTLGIDGDILIYRSRRDLLDKINMLRPAHIILLLDMDHEGEEKALYLKKFLEGSAEKIDLTYWNTLRKFRRLGLTTIESLPKILDNMVK